MSRIDEAQREITEAAKGLFEKDPENFKKMITAKRLLATAESQLMMSAPHQLALFKSSDKMLLFAAITDALEDEAAPEATF